MICPKCHTQNDDEEKFCKNCGFQLSSSRICPTCGKTNDSNSKYCKECGTELTPVNTFRKKIIEENTKESFFSMYKIPIICGLLIILAVGAAAGMAFYNGNSGGDDDFSIIPLENNSGFFVEDEPTEAQIQENATNETNQTNNQTNDTNDTNKSKILTEKVNTTNQTKKIKETVNKTKNKVSKSVENKSKTITEKVDNKTDQIKNKTIDNKTDNKTSDSDKSSSDQSSKDKSASDKSSKDKSSSSQSDSDQNPIDNIIPGPIFPEDDVNDSDDIADDNETDDILDENDTDETIDDDSIDDDIGIVDDDILNDTDDNDTDEISEIEMEDVPNLAQKVSGTGYSFSTIEYDGKEFTKAQCIYIFSEYLLNVENGRSSPIEIKNVSEASSPSGDDSSQSIEKSDYLSIASRVHSWMDSQNSTPNYVGITEAGASDLSPNKMLKLFTLATLDYAVTGDLPESVEI